MPQATKISAQHIEKNLRSFMQSLKLRSHPDGTSYRAIDLTDPNYGVLSELMQKLHDDELPNDWRFGITYDIVSALLEQSEYREVPEDMDALMDFCEQLSDDLTDYTHYSLGQWLTDKPTRRHWRDDSIAPNGLYIFDVIQVRQREEIHWMAVMILDHMETLKLY